MSDETSWAGRIVWRELHTHDPDKAVPFYSALLGWETKEEDMAGEPYTVFTFEGRPIGGVTKADDREPPHWQPFITVNDVDKAEDQIPYFGGWIFHNAADLPDGSRFAVATDPSGAWWSAFRGSEPGSSDTAARRHSWCWAQLLCRDLGAAAVFYMEVVGWQPEEDSGGDSPALLFKREGESIAGAMVAPLDPEARGQWLSYVLVDDVDTLWAQAQELGGTPIQEPTEVPGTGRFCVIGDPTGVPIALWQGE